MLNRSENSRRSPPALIRWFAAGRVLPVFASLGLVLLLAGCGSKTATPQAPVQPDAATQAAQATQVAQPSATPEQPPTPSAAPERVLLLAPAGADAARVQALQGLLAELAGQSGLLFETNADPASVSAPGVRLVVLAAPDPGAAQMAAANPQVQFLAVEIPGLQAGQNLSTVSGEGGSADQQGFLAGYLAALITPDWRTGAISVSDTPEGLAARQGFMSGVVFYCGLCRSAYPPFNVYPQYYELAAANAASEGQAAADYLIGQAVATAYISPGVVDETTLAYLAQAGVNLIGSGSPPAGLLDHWVVSIRPDWESAVRQAWTRLAAGEAGFNQQAPLGLADRNESLLPAGRLRLVEQILSDLAAGYIDTGVSGQTNSSP